MTICERINMVPSGALLSDHSVIISSGSIESRFALNDTVTSAFTSSGAAVHGDVDEYICKLILYYDILNTRIRLWDVLILLPNIIFLVFLLARFGKARLKLRATNSPIFLTFYSLVFFNVGINIARCLTSIIIDASSVVGDYVDVVLWVLVQFFLLSTEISVIVFGLAFGHLDSRSSIRYVLMVTSCISLAYSTGQAALELFAHDDYYRIMSRNMIVYGHGGVMFWFVSSTIFCLLYLIILILPLTTLRDRLALPGKKSFYIYVALLMTLNATCAVGGAMLLYDVKEGLCIIDATTCVYFTFFTPLVYSTFLRNFFSVLQPAIMFSYKNQENEAAEEDVSLPPQQPSFSTITDKVNFSYWSPFYNSSRFIPVSVPVSNPLYIASLQSPDSITGYSIESQTTDVPVTPTDRI